MATSLQIGIAVLVSAAAASASTIAALFIGSGGSTSTEDVMGFGLMTFVATILLATLVYLPILTLGRTRWKWNALTSAVVAALVLNMPAWVVLLAGFRRGMYGGISEVLLFALAFVVGAVTFSLIVGSKAEA